MVWLSWMPLFTAFSCPHSKPRWMFMFSKLKVYSALISVGSDCDNGPVMAGVGRGAGGAGGGGSAAFTWSPEPAAGAGAEEPEAAEAVATVGVASGACALTVPVKINPKAMHKSVLLDDMF